MYAPERQQSMLNSARQAGRVDVNELAESFDVTPETIRRDLTSLERRGVLRRVHGGAIPVERLSVELAVGDRLEVARAEKERIAKAALEQLPDGGSILLDGGTTTIKLAEMLPPDRDFTVVTHSLPIGNLLASRPNITLHMVGGQVRGRTLVAVGSWAEQALSEVYVDVVFAGTNGISAARGLTTPDIAEASVKRAQLRSGRRVVVLADHTKFGRDEFAHVADISQIDTVITDSDANPDLVRDIEEAGPAVILA